MPSRVNISQHFYNFYHFGHFESFPSHFCFTEEDIGSQHQSKITIKNFNVRLATLRKILSTIFFCPSLHVTGYGRSLVPPQPPPPPPVWAVGWGSLREPRRQWGQPGPNGGRGPQWCGPGHPRGAKAGGGGGGALLHSWPRFRPYHCPPPHPRGGHHGQHRRPGAGPEEGTAIKPPEQTATFHSREIMAVIHF